MAASGGAKHGSSPGGCRPGAGRPRGSGASGLLHDAIAAEVGNDAPGQEFTRPREGAGPRLMTHALDFLKISGKGEGVEVWCSRCRHASFPTYVEFGPGRSS